MIVLECSDLQRPGVAYRVLPVALCDAAPRCETSLVWPDEAAPAVRRFVEFVRARSRGGLGYRSQ